jgi:hypothetical protein
VPTADDRETEEKRQKTERKRLSSSLGIGVCEKDLKGSASDAEPAGSRRTTVRLKGVEPSRALAHTDLNRARLPVPPQPQDFRIYRSGTRWRSVTHATLICCISR